MVREFDALSGREQQSHSTDGLVGDVAYSPDGTVAVVGDTEGVTSACSTPTPWNR